MKQEQQTDDSYMNDAGGQQGYGGGGGNNGYGNDNGMGYGGDDSYDEPVGSKEDG